MDKKNESHLDCTLSDTDVFTPPFVQKDINHGIFEDVFPISKLNDNGPIEFNIENSTEKFIDLANSFIKFKIQVLKHDVTNLEAEDVVVPINYSIGSMFNQVDVNLGGTTISSSNNLYSYRAYVEALLNYGKDAKKSQLQMGMYFKDPAGKFEVLNADRNKSFEEKTNYFGNSKIVDISGQIHCDIFNQGRLILNGVPLKITLHRNRSAFLFMSEGDNPNYKLNIIEAMFCIRKVTLTPHRFIELQKQLESVPACYPINRVDVRTHSAAAGLTNFIWDNCYQGQLPNKIIIGMVDNDSCSGIYKKNPFYFKNYDVRKVSTLVNGESLPGQPIKVDFENNLYMDGYRSLFLACGKLNANEGIDISRDEYKDGYTLFGFDLSPSICNGGHSEPVRQGTLKIELEFQKALPSTISVIAYAEFESTITVDKFRNVTKNY